MRQSYERKEIHSTFWKNNLDEGDHLPDLGESVDGATVLKFNEIGLEGSGSGRDKCENGNEPSGAVRCGEFLEKLRNWQLPTSVCSTASTQL
jgi:hypothetical protein